MLLIMGLRVLRKLVGVELEEQRGMVELALEGLLKIRGMR